MARPSGLLSVLSAALAVSVLAAAAAALAGPAAPTVEEAAVIVEKDEAGGLIAHRALYRVGLGPSGGSFSPVAEVSGSMMYRFTDACDGWTVENNTQMRLVYNQGRQVDTTWSFLSWEAKDGLSYRFRVAQGRNGRTVLKLRGQAELERPGGPGLARLDEPAGKTIELPAGTVFPTKHFLALIGGAKGGSKTMARVVFDGASLDNPYLINAVMGGVGSQERQSIAALAGLAEAPAWRFRMAFFPYASRAELPDFELDVRYRGDGIAGRLLQDFGDFSLDLKPSEIELLEGGGC